MRTLVVALLLANLAVLAWTLGLLDGVVGAGIAPEREPQRLAAQVQPQSVAVLSAQAASAALATAQAAAKAAATCLEAGPFDEAQLAQAEAELAQVTLNDGSVARVERQQPAVWMVYVGRGADAAALQRRRDELARLNIVFEELREAAQWQPGLVLGRFEQRAAAEDALAQFSRRGARSAKVVALSESSTRQWLRAVQADPDLAARLEAMKVSALGGGFKPCAR